jgi:MSHA biogenesis protein MshO
MKSLRSQQGFTLIELIAVIVILGVLASSMTSFLRFGIRSYTDAADREELISTARFVIERLNREVRNALPNSLRTIGVNAECLEFMPIDKSVIYLDIPVAPEIASNSVEVLMLESSLLSTTKYVSVYALKSADIYSQTTGVIEEFLSVDNSGNKENVSTINFTAGVLFNTESPTNRLYFIGLPVSYCVEANNIYRYQDYDSYDSDGTPGTTVSKILMAGNIDNYSASGNVQPFQTIPATLQRNGLVQIRFKFVRNLEEIVFNNEIQVPNVP